MRPLGCTINDIFDVLGVTLFPVETRYQRFVAAIKDREDLIEQLEALVSAQAERITELEDNIICLVEMQ